jgi:ADP-ribose pyrophosphatase
MSDQPETLCTGKYLTMVKRGSWEYVTRTTTQPAVAIVAITDDDRLVLVEQFRPPIGDRVIELPAGLTGDVKGFEEETLIKSAQRELLEETGYEAKRWTKLIEAFSSPGLTDELIVVFLAEGLVKTGAGGGDGSEAITVHEVPLGDIREWLKRAARIDFKVFAGLFAMQTAKGDGR